MNNDMTLFSVSPQFIDRAWADGASNLTKACEGLREITGDQLKLLLSRGERELVCLILGGERVGWAVVQVQQLPNIRVLYVFDLYAPNHSVEMYEAVKQKAIDNGCSTIRGAVNEVNERLWQRVGAKKVYTVCEVDV